MKRNENDEIATGLAASESLAERVERLARDKSAEALYLHAAISLKLTVDQMAETGLYFLALQKQLSGSFKSYFDDKPITYRTVLYFMHVAEIVDRHPIFANLQSSTALRELLRLTKPTQAEISERLADVPMDAIQRVARAEIDRLHRETTRRKDHVGGRGKVPALELVERWCKEIDVRLEKIYTLDELNLLEEDELEPLALRLWKGVGLAHWRLKYPHGDVPYPDDIDPRLWIESEPDDGPVETPEYDISHLKKREIRVSLDKK